MEKVHETIEKWVNRKVPGKLILPADFRGIGTNDAIKKALSRLAKAGTIKRLAHGIYFKPKIDPLFGEVYPGAESIARMLAEKTRVHIKPTGTAALNKLGLSTQVPTKLVYFTDGTSKKIMLGKMVVQFKATTHRKMAMKGPYSSLVILALEELDFNLMDETTRNKIRDYLLKEDPKLLKHDLSLASAKVNDYIVKLLKSK